MEKTMLLKGKVAIITGANRGIGKAVLETFAVNGCDLVACIRTVDDEKAQFIESVKEKYNVNVKIVQLDLSSEDSVKNAAKKIIEESPQIDILVNNAGIASGGLFQMTSMTEMRKLFDVNFFNQILFTQSITRLMIKKRAGSIINISSTASLIPDPGTIAYGTSKAAFSRATQSLAAELGAYNIRANVVAPGVTKTDMYDQMSTSSRDALIAASSLKRPAEPQEIANVVLFLASDLATYITGQIIRVDGGIV